MGSLFNISYFSTSHLFRAAKVTEMRILSQAFRLLSKIIIFIGICPQDYVYNVIRPGDSVYFLTDSLLQTLPPKIASQIAVLKSLIPLYSRFLCCW